MKKLIALFNYYYIDTLIYQYIDISTRSNRQEFWAYTMFSAVILFILTQIDTLLALDGNLYLFFLIMTFPASYSALARRLHDTNRSAWWYVILIIPVFLMALNQNGYISIQYFFVLVLLSIHYMSLAIILFFLLQRGHIESNKYGPNPNGAEFKEEREAEEMDE